MFNISISNFKSIKELELKLEPLTILIGPPVAGKSNILDAIGFVGHISKLIGNIDIDVVLNSESKKIVNVEIPLGAQHAASNPAYKPQGDWTTMLSDNCYKPSTITVPVGSTVTWVNKDTASHTVTYASNPLDASTWDLNGKTLFGMTLIEPNQSVTWIFDKEGEYPYFCAVHPWMIGRVIVVGIKSVRVYPYSNSIVFDLYHLNYDATISVTISPRILKDPSRFNEVNFIVLANGKEIDVQASTQDNNMVLTFTIPAGTVSIEIVITPKDIKISESQLSNILISEYGNKREALYTNLSYILRLAPQSNIYSISTSVEKIFKDYSIYKVLKITINNTTIKMLFEEGNPIISINNSKIPFNSILSAIDRSMLVDVSIPVVSYLYSYERYSLNSNFWNYIKGINAKSLPKSILAEDGSNFIYLSDKIAIIIHQLNNALKHELEENIELRLLKDGSLAIFDGIKEVENYYGVSDSLLRMIYYLTVIKTAVYFVKKYGLEKRFILMLEEPEAHVFPYLLSLLADYIKEAIDILYVIVSTHNPLFVSLLWDRVKDVKTYYVFRDSDGNTMAKSINMDKLAEKYVSSIDLIGYTPSMVAEYFEE